MAKHQGKDTAHALTKERLVAIFDRLGLPHAGRELVMSAITAGPARDVHSSGRNVVTQFHSSKNNTWIGTESRHIEFPAAVIFENDPKVIAYYPQPFTRKFQYTDRESGEVTPLQYTPDFLVIREDGIVVIECKPHRSLQKEAERYPFKYVQADDGSWWSPFFVDQLGMLGLRFEIFTDNSFSRVWVENCQHLSDYVGNLVPECPKEVLDHVRTLLNQEGHMTVHELLNAPHNVSADHLLKAIVDGALEANLHVEPIYEPRRAWVYRDAALKDFVLSQRQTRPPGNPRFVIDIEQGRSFALDDEMFTIVLASETRVVLTSSSGRTLSVSREWLLSEIEKENIESLDGALGGDLRIQDFTTEQLQSALSRSNILEKNSYETGPSPRTLSRWRSKQSIAREAGGNEILALAPMTHLRGNRKSRLSTAVHEMMEAVYTSDWLDASAKNYKSCYLKLKEQCYRNEIDAPSYPTLIKFIKNKSRDADVRIRQSSRYEYQQRAFVDSIEYEAPVHGSRPLQYVHIDHTQVDVECISSRTGRPIGRPWLTLAVCTATRTIVGLYLTFESPSYRSVMMVMRDLVRRKGRMPEFVVVDNGSDLKSAAFAAFLQIMRTHLRSRPKGSPRHGSVLERMFGRANTEYIHNLAGNTKATKNVRMVTGKSLPAKNAVWTLEDLYNGLCYWAFEHYPNVDHPALGDTPNRTWDRLVKETGLRTQRRVLFNKDFLIATCPPADRGGTRLVNRQTGVKVSDRYYWHEEFRGPTVADTQASVRIDPFDISSVYVLVKGKWVQARNSHFAQLPRMTEASFQSLSEEYRARFTPLLNQEQEANRMRDFVATFKPAGATAMSLDRIDQSVALIDRIGFGRIAETTLFQSEKSKLSASNCLEGIDVSLHANDVHEVQTTADSHKSEGSEVRAKLIRFDSF